MINVYGDSITVGLGSNINYGQIIGKLLNETVNNYGVSGAYLVSGVQAMFTSGLTDSFLLTGTNDLAAKKLAGVDNFSETLDAVIISRCTSNRVNGVSMGTNGGWSISPSYGGNVGQMTNIIGKWIYTVRTGTDIFIVFTKKPTAGSFKVSIDGIDHGVINCYATESHPAVCHITGLANTSHNIVIENLTTNYIYIDFIASNPLPDNPTFTISGCLPMNAYCYSLFGVNQSVADAYTNAIIASVNKFSPYMKVLAAKVELNPNTQTPYNDVHPNDWGQMAIATSFIRTYRPSFGII